MLKKKNHPALKIYFGSSNVVLNIFVDKYRTQIFCWWLKAEAAKP